MSENPIRQGVSIKEEEAPVTYDWQRFERPGLRDPVESSMSLTQKGTREGLHRSVVDDERTMTLMAEAAREEGVVFDPKRSLASQVIRWGKLNGFIDADYAKELSERYPR